MSKFTQLTNISITSPNTDLTTEELVIECMQISSYLSTTNELVEEGFIEKSKEFGKKMYEKCKALIKYLLALLDKIYKRIKNLFNKNRKNESKTNTVKNSKNDESKSSSINNTVNQLNEINTRQNHAKTISDFNDIGQLMPSSNDNLISIKCYKPEFFESIITACHNSLEKTKACTSYIIQQSKMIHTEEDLFKVVNDIRAKFNVPKHGSLPEDNIRIFSNIELNGKYTYSNTEDPSLVYNITFVGSSKDAEKQAEMIIKQYKEYIKKLDAINKERYELQNIQEIVTKNLPSDIKPFELYYVMHDIFPSTEINHIIRMITKIITNINNQLNKYIKD